MTKKDQPVIYLNIIVKDASGAVGAQVKEKVEESKLPSPMKKMAAKMGESIVTTVATPSLVAKKMNEKLPTIMPEKMAEKGIVAEVESVHFEGCYMVCELQIQKVDSMILAQAKAMEMEDQATAGFVVKWLRYVLELLGGSNQKSLEEEYLPAIIQSKMADMMTSILEEKLEEQNLQTESIVLGEDKQARYFFDKLKELRKATSKKDK